MDSQMNRPTFSTAVKRVALVGCAMIALFTGCLGSVRTKPSAANLTPSPTELGATTADHLEQTAADGISALAKANIQPVLLPGSVYALGSKKYPDARAMIDAGLALVLATDFNPGSSPSASMPMMLSLAVTQMRMSPAEAMTAATLNAAASLNRVDKIGSLDVGKFANFAIYDCEDYRELAYWFGVSLVRDVFVRGVSVSRSGGFQTPDA